MIELRGYSFDPKAHSERHLCITISSGQWNLMKTYHNLSNGFTKIASIFIGVFLDKVLKTQLNFRNELFSKLNL